MDVVSGLSAALITLAGASTDVGMPPRASLTALLSTESLIFAAFSVSATLALPTDSGRSAFYAQGYFAYGVVIVLALIATAGGFALYATLQPDPPCGVNAWARAAGLGIGIGIQPFLALGIARGASQTQPAYRSDEG